MKLAITGSGGFIGSHLRRAFPDHVRIYKEDSVDTIREKLKGVDVVVNLAGAPIIRRWSNAYKEVLINSRIETTRRMVRAMDGYGVHFISSSAVGIYPDNVPCDESCPKYSDDFLGELAKRWENEALKAGVPTAILRLGVILGKDGGALKLMMLPFKVGMGGPIGDGKMMMSWLTIHDLMAIYDFIIENALTGVFNAVAPSPVINYQFTRALGKALNRPAVIPVPKFVLRLLYGEAERVLTGSKEIYPKALLNAGFQFKFPDIDSALEHCISGHG